MFRIADYIATLSETRQLCLSICVVERLLVAQSLVADGEGVALFSELSLVVDELWAMVVKREDMSLDRYDRMRGQINQCCPAAQDDHWQRQLRDSCWVLKVLLKVFRGREHTFELARLGDALASSSSLNTGVEAENQRRLAAALIATKQTDWASVGQLRDLIRSLPVKIGDIEVDERD
ncbi:MAG: hypothetical protein KDB14_18705 [Planctomycetales bacterium]|nr:hypothetical protein [Planctomycetales bacterium]